MGNASAFRLAALLAAILTFPAQAQSEQGAVLTPEQSLIRFLESGIPTDLFDDAKIARFCQSSFSLEYCTKVQKEQRARFVMAYKSPRTDLYMKRKLYDVIFSHQTANGIDWPSAAYEYFEWIRKIVGITQDYTYRPPSPSTNVEVKCNSSYSGYSGPSTYSGSATTNCTTKVR